MSKTIIINHEDAHPEFFQCAIYDWLTKNETAWAEIIGGRGWSGGSYFDVRFTIGSGYWPTIHSHPQFSGKYHKKESWEDPNPIYQHEQNKDTN